MDIFNQLPETDKEKLLVYICETKISDLCYDLVCTIYCHIYKMIVLRTVGDYSSNYKSCRICHKNICYDCFKSDESRNKKKSDRILNRRELCVDCRL